MSKGLSVDDLGQMFSVAEVAKLFGVSRKVVWSWTRRGVLPAYRLRVSINRGFKYRAQDIADFMVRYEAEVPDDCTCSHSKR